MAALLMNNSVREELDLVDDQVAELQAVGEEMRDEFRSIFQEIRDLPAEERRDAMVERRQEIEKMVQDRMKEVLLPQQFNRLEQIHLRSVVQRQGTAAALSQGSVAEALNLTDAQREKLREKSEQLNQELQQKIEELRTQMRDELLDVLDTKQRAQLEELMGDDFDMAALQRGRFGGPGGPRGGPGARGDAGGQGPEARQGRRGARRGGGGRERPQRPSAEE